MAQNTFYLRLSFLRSSGTLPTNSEKQNTTDTQSRGESMDFEKEQNRWLGTMPAEKR